MRGLKKRELSIFVSERVVPHARLCVCVSTCATTLVAVYYAFAEEREDSNECAVLKHDFRVREMVT